MRKTLLSLIAAIAAMTSATAQTFEWGTATWNIEDGRTYDGISELNEEGIVLTYPNPTDFQLTFLNMIAVNYNLYVDDAAEPIQAGASAQGVTSVLFNYNYAEGHKYRIETTSAVLVQANLATYVTDTLSINTDSYTISFTINGPELVKTYDVEGTMSLTITDQEADLTYSLVDVQGIVSALGIEDLSQAEIYGLNPNGSYNPYYSDYFDGWRDADGGFTLWWGGWNSVDGHNAYPAVYCIKLSENSDSVYYYFYDYWDIYDPEQPDSVGGSGVGDAETVEAAPRRAPETSYNSVIWDWVNEDGSITQYSRRYRVDEGKDYKASFAFVANKKIVLLNATLHFVSQEEYATSIDETPVTAESNPSLIGIYSLNGTRSATLQKGINIVKYADGQVKKVLVK